MAGNVWEWTASLHRPYPYRRDDGREDSSAPGQRVLRGGSFRSPHERYLRCAFRSRSYSARRRDHIGFRVCAL
jgi:formylglycine-generating enzyme required for sulfatase activity